MSKKEVELIPMTQGENAGSERVWRDSTVIHVVIFSGGGVLIVRAKTILVDHLRGFLKRAYGGMLKYLP